MLTGKQNHRGKDGGQQFVLWEENRVIDNDDRRLNCTLRLRVWRLVRTTLTFSKKLENRIGAIHYFRCQYNLELAKP